MKRLLLVGATTAAMLAGVWAGPAGLLRAAPQQPAAKATQDNKNAPGKQAGDKKAADKKAADQKAAQAKPAPAPAPSVPADYKAVMDASAIPDPVKRSDATRKAIMDLYSKQMAEAPDRKAFMGAIREKDPGKKVDALRKFAQDFPKSPMANSAQMELLIALIADGKKRALDQANAIIEAAPDSDKAMTMNNVADKFMVGELLLDEAEKMIEKSLAAWDQTKYIADRRKSYEAMVASMAKTNPERKPPAPPTDEQLVKDFRAEKSISYVTRGEIYLKQNRISDAEKAFKELYAANPSAHAQAMAAAYLADLAKKAGRSAEVFDYLMVVLNAGEITRPQRNDLEEAYRKTHNGSLDGLDAILDAAYEKNNPKPVVTPYVAPKTRSDRVVLAEIFTGAGCPPCVGADLAFEGALDRYKPQDVAVLMYHLHIPAPDPMTNASTQARSKFYDIRGVPSFYIDGETDGRGGGPASAASTIYSERVEPVIDKRLTTRAGVKMTLKGAMTGSAVTVKVNVARPNVAAKNLKLQVALVEERIKYTGENGVRFHPMVVRSLAGKDAGGFPLEAGKALNVDWTFDVPKIVAEAKAHLDEFEKKRTADSGTTFEFAEKKHEIDVKKLMVVAFVQDEDSKQILQAATFRLGPGGATTDRP